MSLFGKKKLAIEEISEIEETAEIEASLADTIAPSALQITSNYIQIGERFARTFFIITYPRFLTVNWLSPIINLDRVLNVSMFIHPTDTGIILKKLKRKITQIESQVNMEQEQGKIRNPILETARGDVEDLRDKLVQGTEKFFKYGLYITIFEDSVEKLNEAEEQIMSLFEAKMVYAKPAIFQQDAGLNSTLPLGKDQLFITNSMNTAPLSTVFPFVSSNLSSNKGILYGINRHNNSLIIFDRFSMENGNMVIFGKSGGGKSYAVKVEILRSLIMGTDVIVVDPENEYQHLAETVDGAYFKISLSSNSHINPFDISAPGPDETTEDVLRSKIMDLVGLLRVALGELTPEENSILDRALTETYASKDITIQSDLKNVTSPLMEDLETVLDNMEGGDRIAKRLQRYTKGSFAGFLNQPTNIDIHKKLIVFSTRDMEDELKPVAMFLILQYIWNLIRSDMKKRIMVVDEAWWMLKSEAGGSFLHGIAKRCRKYWLGLTTITQDIPDFMSSPYGKPIVSNSSLQILFKQSPSSIEVVQQTFNLTDEEKYLLLQADVGEGIFFAGLKHAAIKVVASYTEDQIVTTNPEQIVKINQAKEELARQ
ncbi:ATP-binding protein [Patescibacteria group bacterium]|nr:ATP-binding protein [Patescibacteria group bacterium]MBU4458891.1 ATP-binding protein [Patescibacteria group bacterium]MCG2696173.1 ATP-binding protein [Candidatus Portnoybacteria bacterium]